MPTLNSVPYKKGHAVAVRPQPYRHVIPAPIFQFATAKAVKTRGATGKRPGESTTEMVARRLAQRNQQPSS